MFKSKSLTYIIILLLCVSFSGCAGLQRKFTRKKKKEDKPSPVITLFDYSKDLRVEELYKKRFLFWRTWHSELIERMDGTYKKRRDCYDQLLENLMEMQKYLSDSKVKELGGFIERIRTIDTDIGKRRLTKSEKHRMSQLLEKTMRQIEKSFSYSDVKDSLELNK